MAKPAGWDPDSEPPRGLEGAFDSEDLGVALARWAAEARTSEAAKARSRERWLRQQAAETSSFDSVLADLADRGHAVVIATGAERRYRAVVLAIGADFVAIRTEVGAQLLLARSAITSLRSRPGDAGPALSGRPIEVHLLMIDAIAELTADRARVAIRTGDAETLRGTLRAVGTDVIAMDLDGDERATVYVPIAAVLEVQTSI